jgi:hypothetical protein
MCLNHVFPEEKEYKSYQGNKRIIISPYNKRYNNTSSGAGLLLGLRLLGLLLIGFPLGGCIIIVKALLSLPHK